MSSVKVIFAARSIKAAAKPAAQGAIAIAVTLVAVSLLADRLAELHVGDVLAEAAATPVATLFLVALCAVGAFWAICRYDVIAFRAIGARAPQAAVMRGGLAANGMAQTLGFGFIVGGFMRWRMLRARGVGPLDAAAATGVASFGFFYGLAAVLVFFALAASEDVGAAAGIAPGRVVEAGLVGAVILGAVALWSVKSGRITLGRLSVRTSPRALMAQAGLAGMDVGLASLALWFLLPDGSVSLSAVMIAYLAALTFALVSNAPCGFGVFEVTLLAALPAVDPGAMIAAILVFRVFFYALPLLAALTLLAQAELSSPLRRAVGSLQSSRRAQPLDAGLEARLTPALSASERAEDQLAFLGDKRFLFAENGTAFLMYGVRAGALVAMGDPVGPRREAPELVDAFIALARRRWRAPVFYKCGPVMAALCRSRGLVADRVGYEASIDLAGYDLGARARRSLRRKIRQAEKAGVTISRRRAGGDVSDLSALSDAWVKAKGGRESAFSMGRFDPDYLSRHDIFVAEVEGGATAFLSLWRSGDGREWSIDLMRGGADAPMGAMHALVSAAAEAAKAEGAARFNLCLAPLSGLEAPESRMERLLHMIYRKGDRHHGLSGLRRFKEGFAPEWSPRFIARPAGARALFVPLAVRGLVRAPVKRR